MKRILATLLLLASFVLPTSAARPANIYEKVWESTTKYMVTPTNWCNAFSVWANPPTYLTAAHCIDQDLGTINDHPVALKSIVGEIAVIVSDKGAPMLLFGGRPAVGDDLVAFGYAGPASIPFFYKGQIISHDKDPNGGEKHLMMFNNNSMRGMSGGPIVNLKGEVVSMIECGGYYNMGDAHFGCGATYDNMLEAMNIAR